MQNDKLDKAYAPVTTLRENVTLTVILILAAVVRLWLINFPLWGDEIASVTFARQPVSLLWSDWMARETNPPLYYTLLQFWMRCFGDSDVAIRSLSIIPGLFSIYLLYACCRALTGDWRVSIFAALMCAVSLQHVHYSLEARSYIFAMTSCLLTLKATLDIVGPGSTGKHPAAGLAQYTLGAVFALYFHTTTIFWLFLINVAILIHILRDVRTRAGLGRKFFGCTIAALLAWSWWFEITISQARSGNGIGWIARPNLVSLVNTVISAYSPVQTGRLAVAYFAILIVAFGFLAIKQLRNTSLILTLAIGGPTLLYVVSQVVPVLLPRTIFWYGAASLLALSMCISKAAPILKAALITTTLLISSIGLLRWGAEVRDDWRAVVQTLLQYDRSGTVFVEREGIALPLEHYCRKIEKGPCSLKIHILGDGPLERWADGLSESSKISSQEAHHLASRLAAFATVSWWSQDPRPYLQTDALGVAADKLAIGHIEIDVWRHAPADR